MQYAVKHEDSRGLDAATREAVARGIARGWTRDESTVSHGTRAQDFRAICVASAYFASQFEPSSSHPVRNERALTIPLEAPVNMDLTPEQAKRRRIANALQSGLSTLVLDANNDVRAANLLARVQTVDDAPPTALGAPATNAGWIQIAIVAICVGGAVFAQCYGIQKASEIVDRYLGRRSDAQQLLATQSSLVEMAGKHTEAEVQAGKPIPLTDIEERVVAMHERNAEAARERLATRAGDLPSPFTGAGALTSGAGLGLAALLLWVGYETFFRKEVRS